MRVSMFFGDVDLPENMTDEDLLAQVEQDKDLEVAGKYTAPYHHYKSHRTMSRQKKIFSALIQFCKY